MRPRQPADRLGKLIRINLQRIPIVLNIVARAQVEAAQVLQRVPHLMQEDVR